MSVRGAEGAGAAGSKDTERRAASGQRVHFEALVAVGESQGGGFEAESVDVSPEGMRLRTAYLPEVGDTLVCRFDGMGAEIAVEGEVIWRNPKARGGEFGLRFLNLEPAAAEAVRAMCGALRGEGPEDEPEAPPSEIAPVPRGSRVRLHIDGLGSPMKARVREAGAKEVEVGSNLEFLKVGRTLELEDVDHGKKREVTIDHVKVDLDPATNVPQLVVALRFDQVLGAAQEQDKAPLPTKKSKGLLAAGAGAMLRGKSGSTGDAKKGTAPREDKPRESALSKESKEDEVLDSSAPVSEAEEAEGEEDDEARGPGVKTRAMAVGRTAMDKMGPAVSGLSARARGAIGGLVQAVRARRAKAEEAEPPPQKGVARRVTSPPPGGALKSEGRKLLREDEVAESEEAQPAPPRSPKRAAVMGSLLGLGVVLALFGATKFISAHKSTEAGASIDATVSSAQAVAALPEPVATTTPVMAPGTPTANVPLFGATPLSTTEPVPGNPVLADPSADGAQVAAADDAGDKDDEDGEEASSAPVAKEWGQGEVAHPIVLKVKMDGSIEGITGSSGPAGFTISVPGRRALSSAESLSRKDKRIDSLNVINTSHGAEVSIEFKDGVPAYHAKVKGSRLEIALGTEGHKKVAKAKKKSTKSGKRSKSSKTTKKKSHH